MIEEQKLTKPIKIRQIASVIGRNNKQQIILKGLGLNKINRVVTLTDNASIRGMIFKVKHLVTIEEN